LLFAIVVLLTLSAVSFAQVGVAITFGPPPLPVYEQPLCPEEDYIWTPGYWAYDYDEGDYYWVPGTWVLAPEVGFFWTPGYWGWGGEGFIFHEGYWGPQVGFYGGINYGFGYFGEGYEGGRWERGHFFYNRSVNNVNVTEIHNVYNTTVVNNYGGSRVSYNGGNGGINRRPTSQEEAVARERHIPPVAGQREQVQAARGDPQLRASVNRGKPPVAATPRPGSFHDRAVMPAREAGGTYNPPPRRGMNERGGNAAAPRPENNAPRSLERGANERRPENNVPENNASRPGGFVHPKDLPPRERAPAPNSGNAKADQKYQRQQEKVFAKQDQERQKLQQRQEQDHQRMQRQNADQARTQQMEQRHQQQTQQLQQRHEQQQQRMQGRQPQARPNEPKPPQAKH
jgi:hypothetical protein